MHRFGWRAGICQICRGGSLQRTQKPPAPELDLNAYFTAQKS
jgi:hypothetical protein